MEIYDYREAVREDVLDYIRDEVNLDEWRGNRDGLEEWLNDHLWTVDSVTGNGSGSYTFNTWKAEENLFHNWDLLAEALDELGSKTDILKQGAEALDVTIRCYLLGQAIAEALDELEDDLQEVEEDE